MTRKIKSTALDHARRAIGVDTDDAAALAVGGWVIIVLTRERDAALNAIDRALALNPSCATAHYFAALVNSFAARTQAARSHATRALRLSPFDPSAFEAHLAIGIAAVGEGKYEEAAASFGLAAQINKGHSLLHFFQAIALALDGRTDEAAISLERGRELEPGFRVQLFTEFGMVPTIAEKFAQGARMLQVAE